MAGERPAHSMLKEAAGRKKEAGAWREQRLTVKVSYRGERAVPRRGVILKVNWILLKDHFCVVL